jgi:hypothetical protein
LVLLQKAAVGIWVNPSAKTGPIWSGQTVIRLTILTKSQSEPPQALPEPLVLSIKMMMSRRNLLSLLGLAAVATITADSACMDFSNFQAGDVVTNLGNGVRVIAEIKPRQHDNELFPGQAMIFNSSDPTGGDFDLGTPNEDFGGPGIGVGGGMSSIFANKEPQGNILIISEDEEATDPDDNANGGRLKFFFNPPRFIKSIGLLDTEMDVKVKVYSMDGAVAQVRQTGRGNNSYQRVHIGMPQVRRLVVVFKESGAVTDLDCQVQPLPLCAGTDIVVDFEDYTTGQVVTNLGFGIKVKATRHGRSGKSEPADAMIFDSTAPSGGDLDLGTPHESFGGPGVGIGGAAGTLFENIVPQGNILIISEDGDRSDPDDEASGGVMTFTFKKPTYVKEFGILDNEEGATAILILTDNSTTTIDIPKRSNNSFETIQIQLPNVVEMSINFGGSAAVTHIYASKCV